MSFSSVNDMPGSSRPSTPRKMPSQKAADFPTPPQDDLKYWEDVAGTSVQVTPTTTPGAYLNTPTRTPTASATDDDKAHSSSTIPTQTTTATTTQIATENLASPSSSPPGNVIVDLTVENSPTSHANSEPTPSRSFPTKSYADNLVEYYKIKSIFLNHEAVIAQGKTNQNIHASGQSSSHMGYGRLQFGPNTIRIGYKTYDRQYIIKLLWKYEILLGIKPISRMPTPGVVVDHYAPVREQSESVEDDFDRKLRTALMNELDPGNNSNFNPGIRGHRGSLASAREDIDTTGSNRTPRASISASKPAIARRSSSAETTPRPRRRSSQVAPRVNTAQKDGKHLADTPRALSQGQPVSLIDTTPAQEASKLQDQAERIGSPELHPSQMLASISQQLQSQQRQRQLQAQQQPVQKRKRSEPIVSRVQNAGPVQHSQASQVGGRGVGPVPSQTHTDLRQFSHQGQRLPDNEFQTWQPPMNKFMTPRGTIPHQAPYGLVNGMQFHTPMSAIPQVPLSMQRPLQSQTPQSYTTTRNLHRGPANISVATSTPTSIQRHQAFGNMQSAQPNEQFESSLAQQMPKADLGSEQQSSQPLPGQISTPVIQDPDHFTHLPPAAVAASRSQTSDLPLLGQSGFYASQPRPVDNHAFHPGRDPRSSQVPFDVNGYVQRAIDSMPMLSRAYRQDAREYAQSADLRHPSARIRIMTRELNEEEFDEGREVGYTEPQMYNRPNRCGELMQPVDELMAQPQPTMIPQGGVTQVQPHFSYQSQFHGQPHFIGQPQIPEQSTFHGDVQFNGQPQFNSQPQSYGQIQFPPQTQHPEHPQNLGHFQFNHPPQFDMQPQFGRQTQTTAQAPFSLQQRPLHMQQHSSYPAYPGTQVYHGSPAPSVQHSECSNMIQGNFGGPPKFENFGGPLNSPTAQLGFNHMNQSFATSTHIAQTHMMAQGPMPQSQQYAMNNKREREQEPSNQLGEAGNDEIPAKRRRT